MTSAEDPLSQYKSRRDFAQTREPAGKKPGRKTVQQRLAFLVQKHDASRLHYDFRLEFDGVLLSWAVTRGPSNDPEDKRLAVRTENHPLEYGTFEGTIPKKQYGGGTVMLWDTGWWEPLHDVGDGLEEGKLHFRLHGARMAGGWALVRMKPRKKENRENWLLIKERDDLATDDGDSLTREATTSIASGREMKAIATDEHGAQSNSKADKSTTGGRTSKTASKPKAGKGHTAHRGAKSRSPGFEKPQLATLVDEPPDGDDWLHEVKFDGYRMLASIGKDVVRCFTRNGHDWTETFAGIAEALSGLDCASALIDGEVVAGKGGRQSGFSALQKALKSGDPLTFHAFDILALDGSDWRDKPQIERKDKLGALLSSLPETVAVHYSEHVRGSASTVFSRVCKAGGEGIVSKRADAPYRGRRSKQWLKTKCTKRQEFVIGGFAPSDKKGRPFASILLGTQESGDLIYRGRVGTGFDEAAMDDLAAHFSRLTRKTSPFRDVPRAVARDVRWLTPKLVAEVDFAEFTDDGHIRHGAFLGLREDKDAGSVTMETRTKAGKPSGTQPQEKGSGAMKQDGQADTVLGIRISHPDRVLFVDQGVAKIDVARYFGIVAKHMLPFVGSRPLSLVRCPQGPEKACFFQKHASDGFPEAIKEVAIEEKTGGRENYLYVEDGAGLVAAVQMGTLEFHVWGASIDKLEAPERMIFDLDPDESLSFAAVKDAAVAMRDRLDSLGLRSLVMATGGKGVHVIVPLERRADWQRVKDFAKGVAIGMAADQPDRFTATMSKAKRNGRVFIDWLRNERGATAVAPYSTRSRAGAPIATPITWDELASLDRANGFHIADVVDRLDAGDPWAEANGWRQSVTKAMLKTV